MSAKIYYQGRGRENVISCTCTCTCSGHSMRPGIGRNTSCAMCDWLISTSTCRPDDITYMCTANTCSRTIKNNMHVHTYVHMQIGDVTTTCTSICTSIQGLRHMYITCTRTHAHHSTSKGISPTYALCSMCLHHSSIALYVYTHGYDM